MKVGIKIMPRDVILDTQGRAVENSMKANGFELQSCRVGKFLELSLVTADQIKAQADVEKMLKQGGLYNPLIEKFEIQFM
ncbi:MAG: phosphoribosylformylglycinamidine synthase subunit PurS [Bdellovibrio sp.]|nr:phosphoribosylformylglycinamidine synthase subunit PurS [Bdellovibrio sp.]